MAKRAPLKVKIVRNSPKGGVLGRQISGKKKGGGGGRGQRRDARGRFA